MLTCNNKMEIINMLAHFFTIFLLKYTAFVFINFEHNEEFSNITFSFGIL